MRSRLIASAVILLLPLGAADARGLAEGPERQWLTPSGPVAPTGPMALARLIESRPSGPAHTAMVRAISQRASALSLTPIPDLIPDPPRPFTYPIVSADLGGSVDEEVVLAVQPQWLDEEDLGRAAEPIDLVVRGGEGFTEGWRVSTNAGLVGAADLTGSPASELVVLDFLSAGSWAVVASAYAGIARVRVFGNNGGLLWELRLPSVLAYSGESVGSFGVGAYASDLIAAMDLVPDVSGDGKADLFVGTASFLATGAGAGVNEDGRSLTGYELSYRAHIYSGASGSSAYSRVVHGQLIRTCRASACTYGGGIPFIEPADEPGPTGAVQLAVMGSDLSGGLLALEDTDGGIQWTRGIGSGVMDLLVDDFHPQAGLEVLRTQRNDEAWDLAMWMHDSSHGYLKWTARVPGPYGAYPIGDADGDGGTDLFAWSWDPIVINGRDGGVVWTGDMTFDPEVQWYSGTFMLCLCGDLNADGVTDPLRIGQIWGGPDVGGSQTFISPLDGASGSQAWLSDAMASNSEVAIVADADADGATDVVVGAKPDATSTLAYVVSGRGGETRDVLDLDARRPELDRYNLQLLAVAAQLDGAGPREVAIGVIESGYNEDPIEPATTVGETSVFSGDRLLWSSLPAT